MRSGVGCHVGKINYSQPDGPDGRWVRAPGGWPHADGAAQGDDRRGIHTAARVDSNFGLRSFEFSLDPGTGAVIVRGRVDPMPNGGPGARLVIGITSGGSTRTEERDLPDVPVLSLNFSRLLAGGHLTTGSHQQWTIFDPATLRNAPVIVKIGKREVVRNTGERPIPAFRIEMEYQGLHTTSWGRHRRRGARGKSAWSHDGAGGTGSRSIIGGAGSCAD
jgi:hypothetical protein